MSSSTIQPSSDPFSSIAFDDSELGSDDSRPDPFTSISDPPPCKHIGSSQEFLQWEPEHHTEFIQWWLQRSWTRHAIRDKADNQSAKIVNRLQWDSSHRISSSWDGFWQAAHLQTGKPVLICQNCSTELAHPNTLGSGTSTLGKHLRSVICSKKAKVSGSKMGGKQLQIGEPIPVT